jgi:hypothetical protein
LEGYRVIFDGTAAQPLAESKEEYLVGEEKKKRLKWKKRESLKLKLLLSKDVKKGVFFRIETNQEQNGGQNYL